MRKAYRTRRASIAHVKADTLKLWQLFTIPTAARRAHMSKHDSPLPDRPWDARADVSAQLLRGDVADWLIHLEVETPYDQERRDDAERWRVAGDREHGDALISLLSVVDAMRGSLVPKPPLAVRFPRRYRAPHPNTPRT
jgi:hypothetical protein